MRSNAETCPTPAGCRLGRWSHRSTRLLLVALPLLLASVPSTARADAADRERPPGTPPPVLSAEERAWLSPMADTTRRCPQFEPMFRAYGLPVKIFSYIAWRESKCVTRATGWNYHSGASHLDCPSGVFDRHIHCEAVKSADLGLLQINSTWRTVTRHLCGGGVDRSIDLLFDLDCNLSVARHLYDRGGLVHWTPTTRRGSAPTKTTVTTIELPAGPVS